MDQYLQKRIDEFAKERLTEGWSVIPIGQNKQPAVPWKSYYEHPMAVKHWTYSGCNIALVTGAVSGVVVVDCDSENAMAGWLQNMPLTPLRVRTRRGMHFYYQHPGQYVKSDSHIRHSAGFEYDVKGDKSYAVCPPSFRSGHQYQVACCSGNALGHWLSPKALPPFQPHWRPDRATGERSVTSGKITNGVAYIHSIKAIEGQGGDPSTIRAICKLRDSDLSELEAFLAIQSWNKTNALPPWSDDELLRKVRWVYASAAKSMAS